MTELSSMAVGIRPSKISAETLSRRLRRLPIPVVTRIEDENVLVDARTFEMEYAFRENRIGNFTSLYTLLRNEIQEAANELLSCMELEEPLKKAG